MKLLRQWEQVAQVPCPATRFAIATCQDPIVLPKLATAFPACFREGRDNEMDLFSWQRILRVAEKHRAIEAEEARPPYIELPYMWLQYLADANLSEEEADLAGIPVAHQWGTTWWGEGTKVPEDLFKQIAALNGKELHGPLFLEYQGVRYVVGCIWFDFGGEVPGDGEAFFMDPEEHGLHELALVPADLIAFDC